MTDKQKKIDELLTRGVGEFIDPDGIFRKKLEASPEKIVIKFGIDPTRPDIHLGHAVVLRKLRQFQDLGCKVVFLIGDYTAQIGDPTGKSNVRPEVDQKEVEVNMKTYLEQVGKILNIDKKVFSWVRNSDWFTAITDIISPKGQKEKININGIPPFEIDANSFIGKASIFQRTRMQIRNLGLKEDISVITLRSFLWTLKHITYAQIIKRDLFQERINGKHELYLHEMMYPVLQGIDSLILNHIYKSCDLEVGGTDQHFNMLIGREIMKIRNAAAKDIISQSVLSFKILEGTDGKEKMSKSLDNYIGITDEPNDMYGKVMSIPDSSIGNYFELCTDIEKSKIPKSKNPKEDKMKLAFEIVEIYHGEQKAKEAEENFTNTFSKKEIPKNVLAVPSSTPEISVVDYIIETGLSKSKSDARRKIEQGSVELDGEKITDTKKVLNSEKDDGKILKVGKKDFVKISF